MSGPEPDAVHDAVVARVLARPGVVVLLGGIDSGKTTVANQLLAGALATGRSAVFIDTDLGQSTVGPPTTIGLRHIRNQRDLEDPSTADRLYFVGDVTPRAHLLPVVTGTAVLVAEVRAAADLVVIDTSGFVAGVVGQRLKFHKAEVARPDHVIGLQRGAELEPLLAVLRRFTPAEVSPVPVHPKVVATTVEQRAENRRRRLSQYFSAELRRFRVPAAVFMPSLPAALDLSLLEGLLVGLDDGHGRCLGLGKLVHDGEALRLITPSDQAPRGLRLGSTRVDAEWRPRSVDVRTLFGSA